MAEQVRTFDTGATRSSDEGRDDYEGYLSPLVVERFGQYMTKHRVQPDGNVRASDNWQKGIPLAAYMKGLWRHFLHLWTRHRGWPVNDPKAAVDIEEDLCSIIFNAQGYLHTLLVEKQSKKEIHKNTRFGPIDRRTSRNGTFRPGQARRGATVTGIGLGRRLNDKKRRSSE